MEKQIRKTSFTLELDDLELFKKYAKLNNSDTSKEIRKLIKDYNEKNRKNYEAKKKES